VWLFLDLLSWVSAQHFVVYHAVIVSCVVLSITLSVVGFLAFRLVVPGDNHRLVASHWQTWSHNVVSSTHRMSGIRAHNVSGDILFYVIFSDISFLYFEIIFIYIYLFPWQQIYRQFSMWVWRRHWDGSMSGIHIVTAKIGCNWCFQNLLFCQMTPKITRSSLTKPDCEKFACTGMKFYGNICIRYLFYLYKTFYLCTIHLCNLMAY
jgi:hypothetical protein